MLKRREGNFWYFVKIYHNVIEYQFKALYISNWNRTKKKWYSCEKILDSIAEKRNRWTFFKIFNIFSDLITVLKSNFPLNQKKKKKNKKARQNVQKQLAKLSCKLISNTGNLYLNQGVMMKHWWIAYCSIPWICVCVCVCVTAVAIFMWLMHVKMKRVRASLDHLLVGPQKWILYVNIFFFSHACFKDESVLNPKTAFGRFPLQIGLLQLCP